MRAIAITIASLLVGIAGCGAEPEPLDPAKLPALTEEQKKQIQEEDARVAEQERGTPVIAKPARAPRR